MSGADAPQPAPSRVEAATRAAGGVVGLAVGVAGAWFALDQGVGRPAEPGPGMWPLLVCLSLVATGAVLVVRDRRRSIPRGIVSHRLLLHVTATLVAYVLLLAWLGFVVSTVTFMTYWLRFLAKERWLLTVSVAVAGTGILYLLFVHLLGVPLPSGILRLGL